MRKHEINKIEIKAKTSLIGVQKSNTFEQLRKIPISEVIHLNIGIICSFQFIKFYVLF